MTGRFQRHGHLGPIGFALALWASTATWAADPNAADLLPHRAVYEVKLAGGENNAGFARAEGRFVLEWQNICTGFTLNQRMVTQFLPFEGNALLSDLRFSSWESANGGEFRFTLQNYFNEELSEEAEGRADRDAGEITFQGGEKDAVSIPRDIVFPTEFTAILLDAAKRGERFVERVVYDGAEDGGVMEATAFIGGALAPEGAPKGVEGGEALADLKSWPVTLSYFKRGTKSELPDFQVTYHLYGNGISDDLRLDYGDFRLEATLSELTILEVPDCP